MAVPGLESLLRRDKFEPPIVGVIIGVIMDAEDGTVAGARESRQLRIDIALVLALAPLVAAAVRIWLYSGGDSGLFLTLLRTINIPSILIGTGILIIPTLLIFSMFALILDPRARELATKRILNSPLVATVILPVVFIILAYTTPWITLALLATVLIVVLSVYLIRRAWRKNHPKDPSKEGFWSRFNPDSVPMLLALLATFLVTQSNMWLPLERVTVDKNPEVGYVLESNGEWTTLLIENHKLIVIRTENVDGREVCRSTNSGTLAMLIQGGTISNGVDCQA